MNELDDVPASELELMAPFLPMDYRPRVRAFNEVLKDLNKDPLKFLPLVNADTRMKDGFDLLEQDKDKPQDALVSTQDAPGSIIWPEPDHKYYRLCPTHLQPLDPEGRCKKHTPRKWHVGEWQRTSWKILYHNVS